ncbi:MAG: glycosyl transferase [Bacteroidetes bacterium]|nr:MAG: glycosyl transferase [Bacteroidota bacterium]
MSGGPKILVIRFSSIGDIVLTTPVYRALKQQIDAEVHLLTKKAFAMTVRHNPYIDKVYTIDKDINDEVTAALLDEKYDYIVDLHNNLRTLRTKKKLNLPSTSFHKLNVQKWLLTTFKMDRMGEDPHIVYRYMDAAKSLGVTYDGQGMDFFIADEDVIDVESTTKGVLRPDAYVAIAIGASMPTKALEHDQLRRLLQLIERPVALLGGPAEQELAEELAENSDRAVNFAGKTSLQGSASILKQSRVLISPDTGLMHMGAALDHPVISVWGNTVPRFGMTPFYKVDSSTEWHIVEVEGLKCRPCSKIGYNKCPKGHFKCIRKLDIDRIAALANTI